MTSSARYRRRNSDGEPMELLLYTSRLSKRFGNFSALDQVGFSLQAGEVVGLVGRSGAGKSVLAQILSGTLNPSGGELLLGGERLRWPFSPVASILP